MENAPSITLIDVEQTNLAHSGKALASDVGLEVGHQVTLPWDLTDYL